MSEKIPVRHEKESSAEAKEAHKEQLEKAAEKLRERAEKEASPAERRKTAHEAQKTAEKEAVSGKERGPSGEKKRQRHTVHKHAKKQTYNATMRRVESKLPAYQRSFSRVINNDTVDAVSNVASRTVARPSALLGGGVVAFIALVAVTFYANTIGFEVSNSVFMVFVLIGWALGLMVEAVVKLVRRSSY